MCVLVGMDARQLRAEFREGRISGEDLIHHCEQQQATIRTLQRDNDRLRERLARYEPEVRAEGTAASPRDPRPAASYSVDAEERRRAGGRRRRKKSPGRRPTELKFSEAQRIDDIVPEGVPRSQCRVVRERAVWRLESGRAVRVGYRIFAGPDGREPRIPGVTPRCEYGIEILVVLAFLVYIIGISLDKACLVIGFFCELPLAKSQADALLRQLAQHWEGEFDLLCELIAHAAVVYMDETGWKVGTTGCSLWLFATEWQRLFLFGCRKDGDTLDRILPHDVFTGTGISDDAAVYRDRFVRGQKCWAHLLRKIIKLTLLYPRQRRYRQLLEQLLDLYYEAKRAAADGRLGEEGRKSRVNALEDRLAGLCLRYQQDLADDAAPHERDFANLLNELGRLLQAEELFTFVLVPGVDPTNNLSERTLRGAAQDRKAGRTNQTAAGARRRSIIVSVLESLRVTLETFTLATVLEEVNRWMREGQSCFAKQWHDVQAHLEMLPNTS